ncbi:hypothetical protein G9A89_019832 [Geosiphon pyriformis]|nr:hypothetical protein G9A89_019832 [Geosiphon pyriformis]
MSLDALRKQVLSNSTGEERVEVNQRHLIDKILARYSAEFVVFRELMQNADDAKATNVQIIFETKKLGNTKFNFKEKCIKILFKNNGFPFRPEDWNRLKKIAEGNPDEQKIGAFGVGFYSLFSVCEEPFVYSDGQGMAFYWRGDQLFAKRGATDQEDKVWTTFLMDTREPSELPNFENFGRFLATSLGFTGNLREVTVHVNEYRLIALSKKMSIPRSMDIISGLNTFSPKKMFQLKSVDVRNVQLDVERLVITPRAKTVNDCQIENTTIFLRIACGNLNVRVSKEFSAEMERTTKKKPPGETTIQMLFSGFDEHSSSGEQSLTRKTRAGDIFKDLLPYPDQGRIFIGFPTHQTTGCSSHLAARLIPTVERESVDLVDKTLAIYNEEMLTVAGILSRLLYEDELNQISRLYTEMIGSNYLAVDEATESMKMWLENRAAHALIHFSFRASTPNQRVGNITETTFFQCSQSLHILSTNGVRPITSVRLPKNEMNGFIKSVPTIPKNILEQCDPFFKKAKEQMNLIKELDIEDVFVELGDRTLSEIELIALFKWWIDYCTKFGLNENNMRKLLRLTIVSATGGGFTTLEKLHYFLNPKLVPPDSEFPPDMLPYTITKSFLKKDLERWFGNFVELSMTAWIQYIVTKPEIENSPSYAEKILAIIARSWNSLSKDDQDSMRQILHQKRCIPTKFGMKVPDRAYFQTVNLFQDLPVISFQNPKAVSEKFLVHLGVRKHVELQMVFDRLISQGSWDHMQLVKYLSSVELKPLEKERLKITPIWPKEQSQDEEEEAGKDANLRSIKRFITTELYAPLAELRELGLPTIEWKGKWRSNSDEAKFLLDLGLLTNPPLKTVLSLASPPSSPEIRSKALHYFLEKLKDKYATIYNPGVDFPFLPCINKQEYAKPSECFADPACMIMGYRALHQDIRSRAQELGVREHPSRSQLVEKLSKEPPKNEQIAKEVFEYLASRQGHFIGSDWETLGRQRFIPILKNKLIEYINPRGCFFNGRDDRYKEFFPYINFGDKANNFLRSCGVKPEPSATEFAQLLVRSSHEFLNDDVERYLSVLRMIAVNFNVIRQNSQLYTDMKRSAILLGFKKPIKDSNSKPGPHDIDRTDDDNSDNVCQLAIAKDIFLNDSSTHQRMFNPLVAPDDEYMEKFYEELGSPRLSNSIQESFITKGDPKITRRSTELQEVIKERAALFYYERNPNEILNDYNWVVNKLRIREVESIELRVTLIPTRENKVEPTTACISRDRQRDFVLSVCGDLDYLDISELLSKHLYKKPKLNDQCLLNTWLITPLLSLKRKGYPVDRILKKRAVTEKYMIEKSQSPIPPPLFDQDMSESSISLNSKERQLVETLTALFPDCEPDFIRHFVTTQKAASVDEIAIKLMAADYPKRGKNDPGTTKSGWKTLYKSEGSKPRTPVPITPDTTVELRNALRKAVQQCRPNSGVAINNQEMVQVVNESQASYCDVIPGHSLNYVGLCNEIEVYVSKDIDAAQVIYSKEITTHLNSFVILLKDLGEVFQLDNKGLHVYYDAEGPTVAFNRDSSLFFNLRYYLGLHHHKIHDPPTSEAMIYWFMTFCHELGHNFVKLHNSEHEYYFSSFAENYLSALISKMNKRGLIV